MWWCQLAKEHVMEKYHPGVSWLEPAIYRICIQGILDKQWSEYSGGMTIEHQNDPHQHARTIMTGRLADQSALVGVLNSLHDMGCPILSVERMEAV
jgi:hypothetical protein